MSRTHAWLLVVGLLALPAVAAEEGAEPRGWTPTFGVYWASPQRVSMSLGILMTPHEPDREKSGILLQAEPGLGGGKLNLGWGVRYKVIGYSLSLSALQTWGNPDGLESGQTYAGLEYEIRALLGAKAGFYSHVGGDDEEHDWLFTYALGVSF